MKSVIEKSLEEYQKYLEGKDAKVEVVKVTIPVKTEPTADDTKDSHENR